MTKDELIEYMRSNGRKSISLVQMHLGVTFKAAKAFCDSFELVWEVIPILKKKND